VNLAARSRADYIKQICKIESEFGDFPLTAIPDRRTRGEFPAWRDRLAPAKALLLADSSSFYAGQHFFCEERRGKV